MAPALSAAAEAERLASEADEDDEEWHEPTAEVEDVEEEAGESQRQQLQQQQEEEEQPEDDLNVRLEAQLRREAEELTRLRTQQLQARSGRSAVGGKGASAGAGWADQPQQQEPSEYERLVQATLEHEQREAEAKAAAAAAAEAEAFRAAEGKHGWHGSKEHETLSAQQKQLPRQQKAAGSAPPKPPAVVSWSGDWRCRCGAELPMTQGCRTCGEPEPCRQEAGQGCRVPLDWTGQARAPDYPTCPALPLPRRDYLAGRCAFPSCRYAHLPFALPQPPPVAGTAAAHSRVVFHAAAGGEALPSGAECVRVVSWGGDWVCACGVQRRMREPCRECNMQEPCRDWLRGKCRMQRGCRYPHPPFGLPPRTAGARELIVTMTEQNRGAVWRPGGAVAAKRPDSTAASRAAHSSAGGRARGAAGSSLRREEIAALLTAAGAPPDLLELMTTEELAAQMDAFGLQQAVPALALGAEQQQQQVVDLGRDWASDQQAAAQLMQWRAEHGGVGAANTSAAAAPAQPSSSGWDKCRPASELSTAAAAAAAAAPSPKPPAWSPWGAAPLPVGGASGAQAAAAAPTPKAVMCILRVDRRDQSWQCSCGNRTGLSSQPCKACGQLAPCRAWARGMCDVPDCPQPHPPYDMTQADKLQPGAPMVDALAPPSAAPATAVGGGWGAASATARPAQPPYGAARPPLPVPLLPGGSAAPVRPAFPAPSAPPSQPEEEEDMDLLLQVWPGMKGRGWCCRLVLARTGADRCIHALFHPHLLCCRPRGMLLPLLRHSVPRFLASRRTLA